MNSRHLLLFLLCLLATVYTFAYNVKGRVLDKSNKEPLIGATIMIEGTTTGTTTDWDGYFELEVKQNTCKLNIQYVSYTTVTIEINASTPGLDNLLVELAPEHGRAGEGIGVAQKGKHPESAGSLLRCSACAVTNAPCVLFPGKGMSLGIP